MKRAVLVCLAVVFVLSSPPVLAGTIPDWAAPSTWTQPGAAATGGAGVKTGLVTTYPAMPFIPVPPCRLADTRATSGFPAGYGPPSLPGAHAQRDFTVTGQCGIPSGAQAVSFNFTVWAPVTRGDLRSFPKGAVTPTVATLNWEAGIQALANAAITQLGAVLGTGGVITVQVDGPGTVDLIIDVNGYYSANVSTTLSTDFFISSSGPYAIVGNAAFAGVKGGGGKFGVRGITSDATGAGVYGLNSSTGAAVGVLGETDSTANNSAGVKGVIAGAGALLGLSGFSYFPAGVRGESYKYGVFGAGNVAGVIGKGLTASGTVSGFGWLGYNLSANAYGVYGQAGSSGTANWAVYASGNMGASGTKPFVEPHPYKAGTVIRYVALEGPEAGTYFRGRGRFAGGRAVIEVPEDFRLVTDGEGLTMQITPIGQAAAAGVVSVLSMDLNRIEVESTRDVEFFYHVNGVRKTFKDWKVVVESGEFTPESTDATIPTYLSEKQKRNLIQSGVYHEDGTVNMQTAERMGWAQKWREDAQLRPPRQQAVSRAPQEPGQAPRQ